MNKNILYKNNLLLLSVCLVLGCCSSSLEKEGHLPVPEPTDLRIPFKATRFTDAIGVNTHFGYLTSNYKYYEERLKPYLVEIGVKHIRDNTYDALTLKKYKDISQYGIKLLLITDEATAVGKAKSLGPVLWGVEAENELDLNKKDDAWISVAREQQQKLYHHIHSDPATAHLPVVGISLAHLREHAALTGDLSLWMDYGNAHPYAAGQPPADHWGSGLPMKEAIAKARLVCKDKPLITTESGYHNKINNPNHPGVSEEAAAIYHLQLPFVYFNEGIFRIYKYEFLDLNPDPAGLDMECHFGLIRTDGTAKPSFYALKNLLHLLEDTTEDFDVSPLDIHIDAPAQTPVMSTLLQKSDGSYWLALFRNVSVFDLHNKVDVSVAPVPVTIRLGKKCRHVDMYIPNDSDRSLPIAWEDNEITCLSGEKLMLLHMDL